MGDAEAQLGDAPGEDHADRGRGATSAMGSLAMALGKVDLRSPPTRITTPIEYHPYAADKPLWRATFHIAMGGVRRWISP